MRDTETIRAINCEQLATATDRLLVRSRRVARHRAPSQPSAPGYLHIPLACGSQLRVGHPAPPVRASQPYLTPPRASQPYVAPRGSQPYVAVRGSQPCLVPPASAAQPRAHRASAERTMVMRSTARVMPQMLALTVVVPAIVGLAIGIAALL
ncbi:MAG: hypothetical protein E6J90_04600 [Deltaproteobacteria bacterium]|nr:MAG: hypothetical protein E6J91_12130 [Deltaproteobacteria bacterium]TMQ26302.1 MAG: hypothetical protein E6J90_04600 [Deltaproteobacteria bacterium]